MSGKVTGIKPQYNKQNVEKLVKYTNGTELNPVEIGPTDGLGFMASAELGLKGMQWWKSSKGQRLKSIKQNVTPDLTRTKDFVTEFKKTPGSTFMNGYRQQQISSMLKSTPKPPVIPQGAAVTTKMQNAQIIADKYKDVRRLLEEAQTLKGDALKVATKNIEIAQAQAQYEAHLAKITGEIKPKTALGKAKRFVAKKTGASALKSKYLKAHITSPKLRTLSKGMKGGNALFAVVSAGVAGLEVYNTYQALGTKSGNKQLVKSTINTAADVGGWILGAKAGAVAGAAIGSLIPVPVVGTVVGAIVGVGCGLLGSWLAGKAARAVTGPSEFELAEKKQAEIAMNNPEVMGSLLVKATARCSEEVNANAVTEDTQAIAEIYDDVYGTYAKQNQELLAEAAGQAQTQAPEEDNSNTTEEPDIEGQTTTSPEETQEEPSESETQNEPNPTLMADAGTKTNDKEKTDDKKDENDEKSSTEPKVKNKELNNILAELSTLIGYNPSAGSAAYTPGYYPIMPMTSFGSGFSSMYSGMNFNPMMNNFNLFPQFGFMA